MHQYSTLHINNVAATRAALSTETNYLRRLNSGFKMRISSLIELILLDAYLLYIFLSPLAVSENFTRRLNLSKSEAVQTYLKVEKIPYKINTIGKHCKKS